MSETTEAPLPFDAARLTGYLAQRLNVPGAPMQIRAIGQGQSNPTYEVRHSGGAVILRKKPAGPTLPRAHAVDREFRVLRALYGTEVPVPRVLFLEPKPDLIGTPFYVMERLEGRVFATSALPGMTPAARRAAYVSAAETLARLHQVDPAAVGLGDFGRAEGYFARQVARWSAQCAASPAAPAGLAEVGAWLAAHLPQDAAPAAISHGDYRIGNLMLGPADPQVLGVLDWELATLGDPMADLGYFAMFWRTRPADYDGVAGLDLGALGIPTRAEIVEAYGAAGGRAERLAPFHEVFACFRFAAILTGIADRAAAGTAAGEDAAAVGAKAAAFARYAQAAIEEA